MIAKITFIREKCGGMAVDQHWNPSSMTMDERRIVAETLKDIAAHCEAGEFEDQGAYRKYPAKADPRIETVIYSSDS